MKGMDVRQGCGSGTISLKPSSCTLGNPLSYYSSHITKFDWTIFAVHEVVQILYLLIDLFLCL